MDLKNQRGQFVVEAVLLMTVMLSLSIFAIKQFREGRVLAKIVESPWERTSGMIERGVWAPPQAAKHPYNYGRYYTPEPK